MKIILVAMALESLAFADTLGKVCRGTYHSDDLNEAVSVTIALLSGSPLSGLPSFVGTGKTGGAVEVRQSAPRWRGLFNTYYVSRGMRPGATFYEGTEFRLTIPMIQNHDLPSNHARGTVTASVVNGGKAFSVICTNQL